MPFYEVHCFRNQQLVDGKWQPLEGLQIVLSSEEVVGGGIGISMYENLIGIDDDTVVNPANGDILTRTKKDVAAGKTEHYFSKATGILVNAWMRTEIHE